MGLFESFGGTGDCDGRIIFMNLRKFGPEVEVGGKKVLIRIDADVSFDENGKIQQGDDFRLLKCLDTIKDAQKRGAKIILMGHVGRPGGKVVESLSIKPVAKKMSEYLGAEITVLEKIVGEETRNEIEKKREGEIVFLENLRFDSREEQNDPEFSRELASLGEVFINESFASAHRAHSSTYGITEFIPSYAGFQFAKEILALETVLENPKHPVVAAISGAKIETKIALLKNLLPKVDFLVTGGGIGNMFLWGQGIKIGSSISEPDMLETVKELWNEFEEKIYAPVDVRVQRKNSVAVTPIEEVLDDDIIYDIGPKTVSNYCEVVNKSETIIWNGPMGKVELPEFRIGTKSFSECVKASGAYSVVGGGDTVSSLYKMSCLEGFAHVSVGGGAMIAFLEGGKMPAVDALLA